VTAPAFPSPSEWDALGQKLGAIPSQANSAVQAIFTMVNDALGQAWLPSWVADWIKPILAKLVELTKALLQQLGETGFDLLQNFLPGGSLNSPQGRITRDADETAARLGLDPIANFAGRGLGGSCDLGPRHTPPLGRQYNSSPQNCKLPRGSLPSHLLRTIRSIEPGAGPSQFCGAAAEPLLRRALAIDQKALGPESTYTRTVQDNLDELIEKTSGGR